MVKWKINNECVQVKLGQLYESLILKLVSIDGDGKITLIDKTDTIYHTSFERVKIILPPGLKWSQIEDIKEELILEE